jgi:replication factor A1
VGADLGISFDNVGRNQYKIKDLFVGAKDINAIGRILVIYPSRAFKKRNSEDDSYSRTIVIYDDDSSIKIRLWDEHVYIPEKMNLRIGDLIEIRNGLIKGGLDNKPIINLGLSGIIEKVEENSSITIPTLDEITKEIDYIDKPEENLIISGILSSSPRITEFRNQRGDPGKSLQMSVSDFNKTKSFRVLIWNVEENKLPKFFSIDTKIKLIGVRVKEANSLYSQENFEIHGDDGTIIEIENRLESEVITLRLVSLGRDIQNNKRCLAIDKYKKAIILDIDKSLLNSDLAPNSLIDCVPSRILGNTIILNSDDSFLTSKYEESDIPDLSTLEIKIKDISISDNPCTIEAIVLQPPNTTEVTTKNGELVPVTETLLGDDTSEVRITGWREDGRILNKLHVGDRIRLLGAIPVKGREEKAELTIKAYSSIIPLE